MRKLRLAVALAAVLLAATLLPPATAGATGSQFNEGFEGASWYTRWGRTSAPWHTSVQTDLTGNGFLRVSFAFLEHDGTSFFYDTGSAETVRLRYRIRFSPNWVPITGQSGKIPGFGRPELDAEGGCKQGCDAQAVTGPYYSARDSFGTGNGGGTYLYRPLCTGEKPEDQETGKNYDWGFQFANGVWYQIDQTITMNTPDQADGSEHVMVNGNHVWSSTTLCLRKTADVPVGNVWMNFSYGGDDLHSSPSPTGQYIDVDDVIINY